MKIESFGLDGGAARCRLSRFAPASGHAEIHAVITCHDPLRPAREQIADAGRCLQALLDRYPAANVVMRRWFLSDPANQSALLPAPGPEAVSVIGQSPLNGTKVALWVYLQEGTDITSPAPGITAANLPGGIRQLWTASRAYPGMGPLAATAGMLEAYDAELRALGDSLAENCLRTWFFVHDVDINYPGVVEGRNRMFAMSGLTRDTHFIASTGIGGSNPDPTVTVTMDALAVDGLPSRCVTYLQAPTHLNPTYEYGVAFERATAVDYPDRRHVLVSGTASIDNAGRVVHQGDILGQCARMMDNVASLLSAGGAAWENVMQAIVYLRDPADHAIVSAFMDARLHGVPMTVVLAPVCRPAWLVEMECMAVI